MCGCTGSSSAEAPITFVSSQQCQRLFDLFQGDALILVVDAEGKWLFRRGSTRAYEAEFHGREEAFGQAVIRSEAAIRRTMDSCRSGTNLLSFRLNCLSSRTVVVALSERHRLVVVNRRPPRDGPDFDQAFRQVCGEIRSGLEGAGAPEH
jgi:hypothetical protein